MLEHVTFMIKSSASGRRTLTHVGSSDGRKATDGTTPLHNDLPAIFAAIALTPQEPSDDGHGFTYTFPMTF